MARKRKTSVNTRYRKLYKSHKQALEALKVLRSRLDLAQERSNALDYFTRKILRAAVDDPALAKNTDVMQVLSFIRNMTPETKTP